MGYELVHLKEGVMYYVLDARLSGGYIRCDDYETLLKEAELLCKRLKEFDDECPGGLSEIEAVMCWRDKMIAELEKLLEDH